ncbi:aldose epimerase family protein [Dictyobacter arantiisoli]|uniref:Aldose 1-epimerase n=1 Tax=Dictyobacter arantiisoli TaxID=2014874 RepID=A0A5A5T7Q5_9CHLR|nr:hypothetical protein [Dictyobacter arantiisoli]GCF07418.1 aldose 1-epimerase [Dictyobacter arantiisoli]
MTSTQFPMQGEIVLTHGKTTIGVRPDGNLVSHFQVENWPVLYRAVTGNLKRWGMPLMIPNFSQLKGGIFQEKGTTLSSHGFGRDLPWSILQQDQASITLQLTSNEQTRPHYPYEFVFTAHIEAGDGTLAYTLTIENPNDVTLPIAPGFHPYFTVAQQDKADITVEGLPEVDPKAIQWDSQPPNNPYSFPHRVTLQIPQGGVLTIAEEPWEGQYSLATMQVWSEPAIADDHNFVCFEPVVTSEDGLNRPADRLNIPAHSSHQIILRLSAKPF